ncbi:MAG: DUF4062 domain-containing protein [Planctomycetes bacterium]|nr:DUF4062 domain-containing protein [Planctomycetota bacterium]
MARPRVFISSTFYDLKHIRSSLEQFIENLGYEAILSEKGAIAFDPDLPLDESCYREAKNSDVFVLIIGGRYGSPASTEGITPPEGFFDRYASITKREYQSALERDIPIYILVDRSVYTEYETFRRNRGKKDITYAYVDSVNVFLLIDEILSQSRNNPIHQFDRHTEIAAWLREQWGGLFKEMLSRRSGQRQLTSLADQVRYLSEISNTLKRYLEEVVYSVSESKVARKLIETEGERLAESKRMQKFLKHDWVYDLVTRENIPLEQVKDMFSRAKSINELAEIIAAKDKDISADGLIIIWRKDNYGIGPINDARKILGLEPISFRKSRSASESPRKRNSKKAKNEQYDK